MEENEIAKELSSLRKELYDARNLVIKTDNLLKTFHAELKGVADKQALFERRHFMGHVAAYVVIGVLAAGGAILYAHGAGAASRQEADRLLAQARESRASAEKAKTEAEALLAQRQQASQSALSAWQLLTSSDAAKQAQGLAAVAKIDPKDLTPFGQAVLAHEERSLREKIASDAYDPGIAAYRKGDIKAARASLQTFFDNAERLPEDWQTDWRREGSYYLGAALNQLGENEEAVKRLQTFLSLGGGNRAMRGYAGLLLGDSLEKLGRPDDARKAFEAGIAVDPTSQTAQTIKHRLTKLPASGG